MRQDYMIIYLFVCCYDYLLYAIACVVLFRFSFRNIWKALCGP